MARCEKRYNDQSRTMVDQCEREATQLRKSTFRGHKLVARVCDEHVGVGAFALNWRGKK